MLTIGRLRPFIGDSVLFESSKPSTMTSLVSKFGQKLIMSNVAAVSSDTSMPTGNAHRKYDWRPD